MDESTAGSDSDSSPPSSRRGLQPKGVIFAEGVRAKAGSLDGRCGTFFKILQFLPREGDSADDGKGFAAVRHQQGGQHG